MLVPGTEATVVNKCNSYALRFLVFAVSTVSCSLGPRFLPLPPFLWLCVILCMDEQNLHLPLMIIRLFQSVAITDSVAVNNLVNISFLESASIPEG